MKSRTHVNVILMIFFIWEKKRFSLLTHRITPFLRSKFILVESRVKSYSVSSLFFRVSVLWWFYSKPSVERVSSWSKETSSSTRRNGESRNQKGRLFTSPNLRSKTTFVYSLIDFCIEVISTVLYVGTYLKI